MNDFRRVLNSISFIIESNETNQFILVEDIAYSGINGVRDSNTQNFGGTGRLTSDDMKENKKLLKKFGNR